MFDPTTDKKKTRRRNQCQQVLIQQVKFHAWNNDVLGKQGQVNLCELEARLAYIVISMPVKGT